MQPTDLLGDLTYRDWDTGADGTVRFAVVGVGGFARDTALPAIAESDYCETTVLVTGSPSQAQDAAETFDVEQVLTYDQYHDGAEADRYDAVYVVTPNALHREAIETAAALDKAVLSEKPLEATAEDARAIVEACEDAGVPLMTAYRMQADPVVRRVREFVQNGGIGTPVQTYGAFAVTAIREAAGLGPDQWRLDPELAGGGALMDVGIYPLNTARFLLDLDPLAVAATTSGEGHFADVDEHTAFQVRFPERVTGSFRTSFNAHLDERIAVLGTDGRVEIESLFVPAAKPHLTIETGDTEISIDAPSTNEIVEEFDYFAHAILTDGSISPDGVEGLRDVETMMATYEAAERDEWVDVEYSR